MSSIIIHLAVAKKLEKHFKIENKYDYYLGSIAPDIAKQIGENRDETHFMLNRPNTHPDLALFREKYPDFLNNSFDLGYYIHLYTDFYWFGDFVYNYRFENQITLLDGSMIEVHDDDYIKYLMYNDYTDLNIKVIDAYELDLKLFYNPFQIPKTTIEEIPVEKLSVLIDKMGIIIENSTEKKNYIFDIYGVSKFIDETAEKILKNMK